MHIIIHIILFLSITYILLNYKQITNIKENFPYSSHLPWLWPWNQPTRIPRLYYDIRGDPNIAYRRHIFGGLIPYGYVFGPYVYDAQGNVIYNTSGTHYVA